MAPFQAAQPYASPFLADLPEVIANSERRRASRLPCRLSAACWEEGQEGASRLRARVQDASSGGLGLLVRRNVPSGTRLVVELRGPTGEVFGCVKCDVANTQTVGDGHWRLGCIVREGTILPG
jgi:hypothetical protein